MVFQKIRLSATTVHPRSGVTIGVNEKGRDSEMIPKSQEIFPTIEAWAHVRGNMGILFRQFLLTVSEDDERRGKDVKEFTVGNINEKGKAGDDMEIPEEICVQLYIFEKLGYNVTPE